MKHNKDDRSPYKLLMTKEHRHLIPLLRGSLIRFSAWQHPQTANNFSDYITTQGTVLNTETIMKSHSDSVFMFRLQVLTPTGIFNVSSNTEVLRILQLADGIEPPGDKQYFRTRDLVPALQSIENASCART